MKKAIRYSVIVCLVSWVYAAIMIFGFGITNVSDNPIKYTVLASLYMLFPLMVAVVMQKVDKDRLASTGLLRFKIRWSWLVAWILPVVIVLLTLCVNALMPGCEFNTDMSAMIPADSVPEEQKEMVSKLMTPAFMIITTVISGLFAGATINALFAFGEEYGWRNYLVSALKEKKFVCASIFIGIVWGIWHFPLILLGHNYPQHSVAGVFMMVVFCILLSVMLMYFRKKSGSVIVAAIMHGTINAVAGITMLVVTPANDLLNGATGLAGMIVLLIVDAGIYLYDKSVGHE